MRRVANDHGGYKLREFDVNVTAYAKNRIDYFHRVLRGRFPVDVIEDGGAIGRSPHVPNTTNAADQYCNTVFLLRPLRPVGAFLR